MNYESLYTSRYANKLKEKPNENRKRISTDGLVHQSGTTKLVRPNNSISVENEWQREEAKVMRVEE